jgi:pimeloyl-ACP methyl ester carboxylesterase
MQIIVSDLLTAYQRSGKGKQVLVLHGWGDSSLSWQQLATELSKRYEVILLDLPGFGGSQAPPTAWGLSEYAAFVAAFVQKAGLKLHAVIGHSNGGAIAIRGLAAGLLQADKLILLASAGVRGDYKGRNRALRVVTKTGKLLARPLPVSLQKKLRRKVYQSVGSDMLVAEQLQATFKKIITDDVRADAAQLKLPTLLVYGSGDEQTPPRYGELFHHAIAGSVLEILPGAGHFLQLDRPAEVQKLIEDFLA